MKKIMFGIIIGIFLSTSAFAAVQLLMEPGYNYVPAGNFRSICEKAGLPFTVNAEKKQIQISTAKEISVKITPTAVPAKTSTSEIEEPYTVISDGVKYAFMGSINNILKPFGYRLKPSGYFDGKLKLCDLADNIVFSDIPTTYHDYNGDAGSFIEYAFYEKNIKPLITN